MLAKFIPIVRTFTPFVAGIARMTYRRFLMFNVLGATSWILLMTLSGYWLGRVPFVANHFELVVLAIVIISVLPVLVGPIGHGAVKNCSTATNGRRINPRRNGRLHLRFAFHALFN